MDSRRYLHAAGSCWLCAGAPGVPLPTQACARSAAAAALACLLAACTLQHWPSAGLRSSSKASSGVTVLQPPPTLLISDARHLLHAGHRAVSGGGWRRARRAARRPGRRRREPHRQHAACAHSQPVRAHWLRGTPRPLSLPLLYLAQDCSGRVPRQKTICSEPCAFHDGRYCFFALCMRACQEMFMIWDINAQGALYLHSMSKSGRRSL